jgi:TPR repeat protein
LWSIPLGGLPSLKANIPVDAGGRADIIISLVTIDGKVLAEATTALTVGVTAAFGPDASGPNQPPNRSTAIVAPPSSITPSTQQPTPRAALLAVQRPPQISAEDKARAETILARGETYLANGSIEAAREFFERAAKFGLARAALRLAATYDPTELQRLGVQGVEPDRAKARNWYERAKDLGATEAEGKLARLSGD